MKWLAGAVGKQLEGMAEGWGGLFRQGSGGEGLGYPFGAIDSWALPNQSANDALLSGKGPLLLSVPSGEAQETLSDSALQGSLSR